MDFLRRNWRKLALIILGAVGALTAEHTVYKTSGMDKVLPVIVNSIPCTPGEVSPNCPPPAPVPQP